MTAFLAGLAYELTYLGWLRVVDRGRPWQAAGMSALVGGISLAGVGTAVRDPHQAPWLLLGYAAGSWIIARSRPRP